ncbi:MAG: hypothetical protein HY675_11425 [Chloroflexi bacterium]|nr:hypothetical protein [Chloroflexota bacterium]
MCKINPVTRDNIAQARSSLERRLQSPNLTPQQRDILQSQLDYIIANLRERSELEPNTATVEHN